MLETGEADYGWNLQVEPAVLSDMEAKGNGSVVSGFAGLVERILINFTNPDPNLGDKRSEWTKDDPNPHPFLSDLAVRQALSMAIDRSIIAEQLYGAGGKPTCNILSGPPAVVSPNNDACLTQDIEGAKKLLDDAGWVDSNGDGIRETKDGRRLKILYQTSTNSVRQKTQALVQQWWQEIGVDTELKNVDAAVFFGGDPASPDTYGQVLCRRGNVRQRPRQPRPAELSWPAGRARSTAKATSRRVRTVGAPTHRTLVQPRVRRPVCRVTGHHRPGRARRAWPSNSTT